MRALAVQTGVGIRSGGRRKAATGRLARPADEHCRVAGSNPLQAPAAQPSQRLDRSSARQATPSSATRARPALPRSMVRRQEISTGLQRLHKVRPRSGSNTSPSRRHRLSARRRTRWRGPGLQDVASEPKLYQVSRNASNRRIEGTHGRDPFSSPLRRPMTRNPGRWIGRPAGPLYPHRSVA